MYQGDIRLGDTLYFHFTTRQFSTGAPFLLAGSPVISAYPQDSTTQLTAGITLTVSLDSVTGLNSVKVIASGANGYATATNYSLVITTGTVDGISVVGEVIGSFSIEARSALMPTTATRTVNVSAVGNADAILANTVTHGGAAAKLELGSSSSTPALLVQNSAGDATRFKATGSNGRGFNTEGNGTGAGYESQGGATGVGILGNGGATSGPGFRANATSGPAFWTESVSGVATYFQANGNNAGLLTIGGPTKGGIESYMGAGGTYDIIGSLSGVVQIQADTDDIQTRLPAALVGGRMDSNVGSYTAGQAPLQPTVAGRTLDVSAAGNAGIDYANIEAPTTVVNLSGTTIKAVTDGVTVTTNNDKTGYSIGVGGIASTSFAANAIDSAALATSAANEIADAVLLRDLATGSSASSRNVQNALRTLRNRMSIDSLGALTVYQEDDTTPAWTGSATRDAAAEPITEIVPA